MKINYCPSCLKPGYETFCGSCRKKLFGGKKVSHILNFSKPEYEEIMLSNIGKISISGVQPKFPLKLKDNVLELTEQGGEYILKPHPKSLLKNSEQVPANEHLTMQIAAQVFNIDVAKNSILFFKDSYEPCYLTKRFDRRPDGSKIDLEDFTQISGITEETDGDEYKYKKSYEEISEILKKICSAYKVEIEKFFRILIFNYLVNNGDAHLRNFSMIKNYDYNDYLLSPSYDLLDTRLHLPHESEMALDLFKNGYETEVYKVNGHYLYEDFYEFGIKIGIQESRVKKILSDFIVGYNKIEEIANRSFLNDESKSVYLTHIKQSMRKLTPQ